MVDGAGGFPVRVGLFAEESVMGSASRFIRTADLTFYEPVVYHLSLDHLPPSERARPDLRNAAILGIRFPFDLEDLPAHSRYLAATVAVEFDTEGVRAQSGLLVFEGVGAGEASVPELPATLFGKSSATPRWTFDEKQSGPLRPGGHEVTTIVKAPIGAQRLRGSLNARATLAKPRRGRETRVKAPLRFELNIADGEARLLDDG